MSNYIIFAFTLISIVLTSCFDKMGNNYSYYKNTLNSVDSLKMVQIAVKYYNIDSNLFKKNSWGSVVEIKKTKNVKIKCLYISPSVNLLFINVLNKSLNKDTSFYFLIRSIKAKEINKIDFHLINSIEDVNNYLKSSVNDFERYEIIKYVSFISLIHLPRLKIYYNTEEVGISPDYTFQLMNIIPINSLPKFNNYVYRLNNKNVYYIQPILSNFGNDSLKWNSSLKEIQKVIYTNFDKIQENNNFNKRISRTYLSEIGQNYKSDSIFYYYSLPDFKLYRLRISNRISLELLTEDSWGSSVWTPRSSQPAVERL